MLDNKAAQSVEGYERAAQELEALTREGSDYRDTSGKTARQIGELHPKRLNLKVGRVIRETPTTSTLRLVSEHGYLPPFQAGQYINLFVEIDGVSTARPFAISSPPQERGYYDLTVRRIPGGFVSKFLTESVSEGDRFTSTGPMGSFHYNPLFHGYQLVFLAGGSGVAPALSMIRDFAAQQAPVKFHLVYGSRTTGDMIFRDELRTLARQHDFLTVTEVISEPEADYHGHTGFITASFLKELLGPIDDVTFYVCGPSVMYDFCLPELDKLGVPPRRIRVEANGAPANPQLLDGWPAGCSPQDSVTVRVQGGGEFQARSGEPLIIALEKQGYAVENACRSGECSLCRVKLLSGAVFNPPEAKLRASDRQFGWCHSCVAFPVEDIEILL